MNIIKMNNEDIIGQAAAVVFAAQVIKKPASVLGFATGSTPLLTYEAMVAMQDAGIVSFDEIITFNLDEYLGLNSEHPQSYYNFMQRNLFLPLGLQKENIHLPNGVNPDPIAECAHYDAEIQKAGGIDLQILGIGENGHIAFNEPADTFTQGTTVMTLTPSTISANRRFFDREDDVPRQALTMGIATIMAARQIVLIATGINKAQAVHDMIKGPISPKVPASILQMHPAITVFLDSAAASML